MIIKSYEIQKNILNFLKYKFSLLYGENEGLKNDITHFITETIKKKDNDIEVTFFYENEVIDNEENFYNTVYSGSLFSNKKIVVLKNSTDKIFKQINSILEKLPENIFFIVLSNTLEKKSKLRRLFETDSSVICIPCYLDNTRDLQIIANQELKKNNILLSQETLNLLLEKSNNDRQNLKNELEKIKSYMLNKKTLSVEQMQSIINFSGEYKSDNLINECLCGNILEYKKIITELYTNTINQTFLFRILSNKVYRLLNIKKEEENYSNTDSLLNSSKPPIFWKEKPIVKKQLSIWNNKDLNNIIREINDVEILCKKNPQISKIIFFNFFTKICKKANNYS
jgi:DNA polymerase III subunit delta